MNEIITTTATQTTNAQAGSQSATARPWWRRRPAALGVGVGALIAVGGLGLGASAVTANGFMITRQPGEVIAIDLNQATGVYRGRVVSLAEVERLNNRGQAMFSIANRELACQGVMLYLDTQAQADAYGRGYLQRQRARSAAASTSPTTNSADPCQGYEDAPNFVPAGVTLGPVSPDQR